MKILNKPTGDGRIFQSPQPSLYEFTDWIYKLFRIVYIVSHSGIHKLRHPEKENFHCKFLQDFVPHLQDELSKAKYKSESLDESWH